MKDRVPYMLSFMFGIAAVLGWLNWDWSTFTIFCAAGSALYLFSGILVNAFRPEMPKQPDGPQLAPDGTQYSMGRVLLYATFLVFLISFLRNDFHSATTYFFYFLIPLFLALKYITWRPRQ